MLYENGISFNFYMIYDQFYFGLIGETNVKINHFITSKSINLFDSYSVRLLNKI